MKTIRLIAIAVVMLFATMVAAQEVRTDYTDGYRWHGFILYGDSYLHPGATITVREIDIGAVAHADDFEADDLEYWDTSIGYTLPMPEIIEGLGLNVRAGYHYLILPEMDVQEATLTATLPISGVINPRYTISYIIPDNANRGSIHTIGLDAPIPIDSNSFTANAFIEAEYNDGVNPFGDMIIHDWTHVTAGIVLDVPVPLQNVTLQPGIYYQHSFEPELLNCREDEVFYSVGVKYAF